MRKLSVILIFILGVFAGFEVSDRYSDRFSPSYFQYNRTQVSESAEKILARDPEEFNITGPRFPGELKNLNRSHKIKLIYLVPKDRVPTPNYADKIRTVMTFVADMYREDGRRRGWPGHELDFHFTDGEADVLFFRSDLLGEDFPKSQGNSTGQWNIISEEITNSFGSPSDQLYVVFAETYGFGDAEFEWPGGIALGARYSPDGGLGVFSSWILRDEFSATNVEDQIDLMADATPIVGRTAVDHGSPSSPRYEFIEDGFGAVAHELGHALGLPHDLRNEDQYIMGNGFRNFRRNYLEDEQSSRPIKFSDENAVLLRWSRYLNADANQSDHQSPEVSIVELAANRGEERIKIKLSMADDHELGAVLFGGNSDTVIGGVPLEGNIAEQEFELRVPPIAAGLNQIKVRVADRGGNIAELSHEFHVE